MIKLIVLDVDGTLTDGRLYVDEEKNFQKSFDVKDGFAIVNWIKFGGIVGIITGKSSEIVERRAKELGITEVHQGVKNKSKKLKEILDKYKLSFGETAYIGDDLNDLGVITKVGFSASPIDAVDEVTERVDYVATKKGGCGAVREVIEKIMKDNKMWEKVVESYLNEKTE